jgi:serine/threonine protein kinase
LGEDGEDNDKDNVQEEARLLTKLDHPSIIKIQESFTHENKFYIIMEYIPGIGYD